MAVHGKAHSLSGSGHHGKKHHGGHSRHPFRHVLKFAGARWRTDAHKGQVKNPFKFDKVQTCTKELTEGQVSAIKDAEYKKEKVRTHADQSPTWNSTRLVHSGENEMNRR